MRQVGKESNVSFKDNNEKIEPFTLANAFEGDLDRTQYVASLYNSDQQTSAVDENSEYVLFMEVMEQIISMCVAATISSAKQGMRSNARALVKGTQLLMARLGDRREVASEGGSNVAAIKFTAEQYANLGFQASLHVYVNPNNLAIEGTASAMAPYLRGARALLPTDVPKAGIGVIVAKEGVDGTRNFEEQNGFYVDGATSSANLNVTNMSCVATQKLAAAAMRDSKEEVVRNIKTWIETVYVIVFDIKDGVRWRLESLVMQHFLLIVAEISHQPSVNAQLLRRVAEQALYIVSFASNLVCRDLEFLLMVELTCFASHFQAARFLAVPVPGREAVTISDALLRAIDRLRSKLDDYAIGMGSQMVVSNFPNPLYAQSAPGMQHTGQQQRQAVLQPTPVRPALSRLLGGMGSGSPLCTISVHDPAKGGDAMKWPVAAHATADHG